MMRTRVLIENVIPEINGGDYFIKRTVNGGVVVSADIFADGHDEIRAVLLFKHEQDEDWQEVEMVPRTEEDRWKARFVTAKNGFYRYKIQAWVDHLKTWYEQFKEKFKAGRSLQVELQIGKELLEQTAAVYDDETAKKINAVAAKLNSDGDFKEAIETVQSDEFEALIQSYPLRQHIAEYDKSLKVRVGNETGLFSSWYQLFPRSTAKEPGTHGTFKDVERLLPRIADLGFDVLYFPPIHPIGTTSRKGRNNTLVAGPDDPGSPWAIGSEAGGHYDIHPQLGTFEDFEKLLKAAHKRDIEIALDLAFQCSPDHPWVKEHPEWFHWRPDGNIAFAENPPKRYEDIVPLNFETADCEALWKELKKVVLFWIEKGIRIFRVAVPHTKPVRFWEWLIGEIHKQHPDVIFLAASFTNSKMMNALSKVGFSQSYTDFIWCNTKEAVEQYMKELTGPELRQYYRPNFWPNVPDILPAELRNGNSNIFALRLLLAATLSSSYGIYGPAFEYMDNEGVENGEDEYAHSEKYEIRHWDWEKQNSLTYLISKINEIRNNHPALQSTFNISFTQADNDELLSYIKLNDDKSDIIWCVANFNSKHKQSGYIQVPKKELNIRRRVNLRVTDLLTNQTFNWFNDWNFVELHPDQYPMHIFKVEVIHAPVPEQE